MKLKKGSFADFSHRIKSTGKSVVVYGAGVIGKTTAVFWLEEYQLEEDVLCYVDADTHKQGQHIKVGSRDIPIRSLSALDEESGQYILLVAVSAFEPVVQALKQIPGARETEVYFLPIMLLDIAHATKEGGIIRISDTPLIPKKIHYCWFGGNPIPTKLQRCIDTWKTYCPDYEIIRWDESNYDVSKNGYMKQAYVRQKWGYIPDYARLDILFHHGGIYLDTDVELLRSLDDLLYQPAFCSTEKWGVVNMGVSGAEPKNPAIQSILDCRKSVSFLHPDGTENLISSGEYDTLPLVRQGLRLNGETQTLLNNVMTVYASDFFQPFDYISGETRITENTFSIHYFSGTWLEPGAEKARKKTRMNFCNFLKRLNLYN